MNTNLANVVGLHTTSVPPVIERFINERDAENTRTTYRRHINKTFMYMCGKDFSEIVQEDLYSITVARTREYLSFLKKEYRTSTVNQTMAVCNALFEYLKGEEAVKDNPFSAFKAIKSKKEVSWGSFTVDELESLYDYCLNLKDRGVTKKLYFEFLITMTCRKSIAQNLKFKNIKRKLNREDQQYYWVLTGFDKTQEINRAIPNDLYQRLSDNFSTYSEKDKQAGLVFNVENQTLERTLNEFCKYAGIDKEERRLCQHSLKSTGLDIIYDTFNDIKMVAEAAGHADINVDYSKYIGKIKNFAKQPSILLSMTRDHCKEELDELSKEELLNIIMSCDEFVAKKLCLKKDGVI